jgi:hypothetical protein
VCATHALHTRRRESDGFGGVRALSIYVLVIASVYARTRGLKDMGLLRHPVVGGRQEIPSRRPA